MDNPDEALSNLSKATSLSVSVCTPNVALQIKCCWHWRSAEKSPMNDNSEWGKLPRICSARRLWLSKFSAPAVTITGSENPRRDSTAERISACPETDGGAKCCHCPEYCALMTPDPSRSVFGGSNP